MKSWCAILLAPCLVPALLLAETPDDLTSAAVQANTIYEQGQFAQSAQLYQKVLSGGLVNGHILYNLGNAHYRLGQWGKAVADYRKALLLLPGDADVKANLRLTRQHVTDKIEDSDVALQTLTQKLLFPYDHWSKSSLLLFFFGLYFLFWALFVLRSVFSAPWLDVLFTVSLCGVLISALLTFGVMYGRAGEARIRLTPGSRALQPAVVVVPETKVYSGNAESFQVVFVLHDGAEIEINERRGDWVEVLLPAGRRGWAKAGAVEVI